MNYVFSIKMHINTYVPSTCSNSIVFMSHAYPETNKDIAMDQTKHKVNVLNLRIR